MLVCTNRSVGGFVMQVVKVASLQGTRKVLEIGECVMALEEGKYFSCTLGTSLRDPLENICYSIEEERRFYEMAKDI